VTRKSHDVSAIVQKFMQIMAGDERRRALFGANEIDDKESHNTGECGPRRISPMGIGTDRVAGAWIRLLMSFLPGIDYWLSRVPLGKESCARTGRMGKAAP